MTKAKTAKYPTLRARVTQEQYDKAYANGWPKSVKDWINGDTKKKSNVKKTNTTNK